MSTQLAYCPKRYVPRRPETTKLYKLVSMQLDTFVDMLESNGQVVPKFVKEEFEAYLKCGVLAHGFLRRGCASCQIEYLVGFSCKKRGFCPSCLGRRMAETAAKIVKERLPRANVRQFVLSVPFPLRQWLSNNKKILAKVVKVISDTLQVFYDAGSDGPRPAIPRSREVISDDDIQLVEATNILVDQIALAGGK